MGGRVEPQGVDVGLKFVTFGLLINWKSGEERIMAVRRGSRR